MKRIKKNKNEEKERNMMKRVGLWEEYEIFWKNYW